MPFVNTLVLQRKIFSNNSMPLGLSAIVMPSNLIGWHLLAIMFQPTGNVKFHTLGLTEAQLASLEPEEKFLWWTIRQSADDLRRGMIETPTKTELISAIEAYDWFMGPPNNRAPLTKLRIHYFPSVCTALNVNCERIRQAILKNPEFPSRSCLMQRLNLLLAAKKAAEKAKKAKQKLARAKKKRTRKSRK